MFEEISDAPKSRQVFVLTEAVAQEFPRPRARRAQLAVGTLFLVNGAAIGSWVPHIPERAHALGLNAAQLGTVLLAGGIGALCAMPLAGSLLHRFGSRKISIVTGLLFPALLTAAILLPSVPLLVAVLFLTGLNAAGMDVAMNSHGVLIEALLGRRTISLFHAVFSVGCFAGAGLHSYLMERNVPDLILVPVSGVLLLGLVLGTASMLLPKSVEEAQHAEEREPQPRSAKKPGGLRARLPHPRLLLLGLLCFSTMVTEGAMGDWSALYLRVVHHVANGTAGYGYTCFAGLMVLGRFTGDPVVARLGELRTLRYGGLLGIVGLVLILFAQPFAWALLGFALVGAGVANASPVMYRTAGTLPGFAPGEGLSTTVGVGYAGLLVGPPLLGVLAHWAGYRSIFWVLLALSVLLAFGAPLVRSCEGVRSTRV